jgi:hypothetical protein
MLIVRTCITLCLVLALAAPGFGQTTDAAAPSQAQAPVPAPAPPQTMPGPSRKGLRYGGSALFVAGMATAMYGFIRVGNGEYSTFGEASSRNKPLGAAGLAAAFGGGAMMFLGTRARRYAPSTVAVNREGVSVEKTITW